MVVHWEAAAPHLTGFTGRTVGGNLGQLRLQTCGCFLMVTRFKLIKIQTKRLGADLKVGACRLVRFLFWKQQQFMLQEN